MSKYDILQYVKFAKEAIEEDDVKDYDGFVDWLHKTIDDLKDDPLPSSEAKLAARGWVEAWDEKIEDLKKSIRLRGKSIMSYYYRDFVEREKILSEKEFDDILLECGLIRVKNNSNKE